MSKGVRTARGDSGWPAFGVLGAGNGGQAMAGHLASQGWDVILYNRSPDRLRELLKHGVLTVSGAVDARVPVEPCARRDGGRDRRMGSGLTAGRDAC